MIKLPPLNLFSMWFALALVAACASAWAWALNGDFGACVKGSTGDSLQKTVAALEGTIDLGIKLAVALIGAGGALLFGLKSGLPLSSNGKVCLLTAVLLLSQSVLASAFWKMKVANGWLNECLNLIAEDVMQRL